MKFTLPSLFARTPAPRLGRDVTRETLAVLDPPKWQNTRGGAVSNRALRGLYHGKLVGTGNTVVRVKKVGMQEIAGRHARFFKPNVTTRLVKSDVLGASFRMPVTMAALKAIYARGGFDNYLLHSKPHLLTREATRIRDLIRSILEHRIDSGDLSTLPLGISPSVSSTDRFRPVELQLGDALVVGERQGPKGWRRSGAPLKVDGSRSIPAGKGDGLS